MEIQMKNKLNGLALEKNENRSMPWSITVRFLSHKIPKKRKTIDHTSVPSLAFLTILIKKNA